MQPLSLIESEVLDLIRHSIEEGIVPSVREICAKLHIKSTSTAHRYLTSLQEKGYILRDSNLNRAIRLPGHEAARVPVVGVVTAGKPILAVESIEEYIPYGTRGGSKDLFALHVRGNSMIQAGILDGDLVVARRSATASNGDIVVALLEDEATVKRFYKEDGHYRLQPENDAMDPIYCDEVIILGRVVGLQRNYE